MFKYANPNPASNLVGDCVIRGISLLMNKPWEYIYMELCVQGYNMYDMPSSNAVWSAYLMSNGYQRYAIPNTCSNCYTIKDFCADHPYGNYLLATGTHVVTCKDGNYYDTWDSGDEIPIYYFTKED